MYVLQRINEFSIGDRIKELREAKGLTKTDLTKLLSPENADGKEMSYKTIARYESGQGIKKMGFEKILKMCEIFDCDINYLLCDPCYDETGYKTKSAIDIKEQLGLSEKAQNTIIELHNLDIDNLEYILNVMCEKIIEETKQTNPNMTENDIKEYSENILTKKATEIRGVNGNVYVLNELINSSYFISFIENVRLSAFNEKNIISGCDKCGEETFNLSDIYLMKSQTDLVRIIDEIKPKNKEDTKNG